MKVISLLTCIFTLSILTFFFTGCNRETEEERQIIRQEQMEREEERREEKQGRTHNPADYDQKRPVPHGGQ